LKFRPNDVNTLLELSRCLLLAGDDQGARWQLIRAQTIAPQNETVLGLLKQVNALLPKKGRH
jgi:uncharacterized protein HemY